MTMVGHRHSKGALVALVNWLLVEADKLKSSLAERQGMVEHWVRSYQAEASVVRIRKLLEEKP